MDQDEIREMKKGIKCISLDSMVSVKLSENSKHFETFKTSAWDRYKNFTKPTNPC